ncbi:FIMAH domain-containing protein [Micromonospora coxensis]|uniref:FIMAH domain-containing protein n=1 Tax=Micromonospora coxensis TaxID=356852 RepID=UPI003420A821
MSAAPGPRRFDEAPTSVLPAVPGGTPRRHRAVEDGRRIMWAAVAGAVVMVLVAALMVAFSGDDAPAPGRAGPAPTAAVGDDPLAGGDEPSPTEDVTPSPTVSPSPRTSPPSARPADLLAGLQAALDRLERQGELRDGAADELGKRLRDIRRRLGQPDKAREKLREFAEKLVSLRREGKISASGYDLLAAGTTQLAQALPR